MAVKKFLHSECYEFSIFYFFSFLFFTLLLFLYIIYLIFIYLYRFINFFHFKIFFRPDVLRLSGKYETEGLFGNPTYIELFIFSPQKWYIIYRNIFDSTTAKA